MPRAEIGFAPHALFSIFRVTTRGARLKLGASTIARADLTLRRASFHPAFFSTGREERRPDEPGLLSPSLDQDSGDPQNHQRPLSRWTELGVQLTGTHLGWVC
jgi:hypothetical protein